MQELLTDVASLSNLITLEFRDPDGSVRAPSFAVNRVGSDIGIRFAGLPMGHEFTSLVLALLMAVLLGLGAHFLVFRPLRVSQWKHEKHLPTTREFA